MSLFHSVVQKKFRLKGFNIKTSNILGSVQSRLHANSCIAAHRLHSAQLSVSGQGENNWASYKQCSRLSSKAEHQTRWALLVICTNITGRYMSDCRCVCFGRRRQMAISCVCTWHHSWSKFVPLSLFKQSFAFPPQLRTTLMDEEDNKHRTGWVGAIHGSDHPLKSCTSGNAWPSQLNYMYRLCVQRHCVQVCVDWVETSFARPVLCSWDCQHRACLAPWLISALQSQLPWCKYSQD